MATNHNIQALRAIAAIAVMLFHALPFYKDLVGVAMPFEPLLFHGYAGVDVFFVISGYVIAMSTAGQPPGLNSAVRFIEQRAFRIYLGYWPILALVSAYYLSLDGHRLDRVDAMGAILLTTPDIAKLVIGQSWSLVYELFFYVLFAALLGLAVQKRVRVLLAYFALVVAGNALAGEPWPSGWLAANPFVLEFIGGTLLYHSGRDLRSRTALATALLLAVLLLYLGMEFEVRRGLVRAACFGGAGLGLLTVAVILGNRGINRPGLLARLGGASYTLYLCHYALIEFCSAWIRAHFPDGRAALPTGLAFGAGLILIVLVSLVYYQRVEKPLYLYARAGKRWRPSTYLGRPETQGPASAGRE